VHEGSHTPMPLAVDMEEDVLIAWPRTRSGCPSVFATASCQHMHVRCLMKIPDEGIALECLARHPSINEGKALALAHIPLNSPMERTDNKHHTLQLFFNLWSSW